MSSNGLLIGCRNRLEDQGNMGKNSSNYRFITGISIIPYYIKAFESSSGHQFKMARSREPFSFPFGVNTAIARIAATL